MVMTDSMLLSEIYKRSEKIKETYDSHNMVLGAKLSVSFLYYLDNVVFPSLSTRLFARDGGERFSAQRHVNKLSFLINSLSIYSCLLIFVKSCVSMHILEIFNMK